jgi:peptidoglycan hydrolase CwlO-like protein
MAKTRILWTLGLVSFLVGFIAVALSAQAQRSIASLDDLLTEVRGLRSEVRQASSASIRTQLLTARLQLQEQRIYTAAQQLTEAQKQLAGVRGEIRELQQFIDRSDNDGGTLSVEQQNNLRREVGRQRQTIDQMRQREQELKGRETELINNLSAEQARWAEFNGRLDEIERSLTAGGAR